MEYIRCILTQIFGNSSADMSSSTSVFGYTAGVRLLQPRVTSVSVVLLNTIHQILAGEGRLQASLRVPLDSTIFDFHVRILSFFILL